MSISRGAYGSGCRITTEYFLVSAYRPEGGCYTDIIGAPTRGIAYSQMQKEYPDCRIELRTTTKERYLEEMEQFNYWQKHRGGARGPEPIC